MKVWKTTIYFSSFSQTTLKKDLYILREILLLAVEECLKIGATLSHQDQVTLLYDEEVKKLEQQNVTLRFYALPEINIATNEAYNDLRQMHDEVCNAQCHTHVARKFKSFNVMLMLCLLIYLNKNQVNLIHMSTVFSCNFSIFYNTYRRSTFHFFSFEN